MAADLGTNQGKKASFSCLSCSRHISMTEEQALGVYVVDVKADQLPSGGQLVFTFHWAESERWEGRNFDISL
jgi:hypothetical protein